jgi:Na+-transporting NADH:ubiquinone oxidoreductase subunit A
LRRGPGWSTARPNRSRMMSVFKLKRGLNIPLLGAPIESSVQELPTPVRVAVTPQADFGEFRLRLAVEEGDVVQHGAPLAEVKACPEMKIVAPASGKVVAIERGARRMITRIVIEVDPTSGECEHGPMDAAAIAAADASSLTARLLVGGVWPLLRSKPLAKIARPGSSPKAILISGMETGPNQADPEVLLSGQSDALQAGVTALGKLTTGTVYLTRDIVGGALFDGLTGVEQVRFSGPHPAGDAETQINFVCPPADGQEVWFLTAADAALIGAFLLSGMYPGRRVIAVAGAALGATGYARVQAGAPAAQIVEAFGGAAGDVRTIDGSILTGRALDEGDYIGFNCRTVTVIPEGGQRDFLGWLGAGANKFSLQRLFVSKMIPGKRFNLNTTMNGGARAHVPIGSYERVVPSDIEPVFLMKSILAQDIEEMVTLGLLEMSREEAALCTFVCPSKINVSEILLQGWAQYESEA